MSLLRRLRREPLGLLALIISVGTGTAWAADALSPGSVKTEHIATDAITTTKVRNGQIGAADLSTRARAAGYHFVNHGYFLPVGGERVFYTPKLLAGNYVVNASLGASMIGSLDGVKQRSVVCTLTFGSDSQFRVLDGQVSEGPGNSKGVAGSMAFTLAHVAQAPESIALGCKNGSDSSQIHTTGISITAIRVPTLSKRVFGN